VRSYGPNDASTGLAPPRIGMRILANAAVRWSLSGAAANAPALLVLGLSNQNHGPLVLPTPLDPFGLPGWTLCTSTEVVLPAVCGAIGMDRGATRIDLALPPGRTLATTGLALFAQWLWFDPNNLAIGGSTVGQRFFVQ
jgi:hypothetical protein